ncbi:hypothetical protein NDU88_006035 [Pleurodeles waltl]|uniref:Uncharacterized protein n=1 Tax=Pleurodeles waltl TaxID=8319 RepID=A0AAV7TCA8_PLEWA|nr:hypothetical protein NDU88_006035 [Pleurodeles waltl]
MDVLRGAGERAPVFTQEELEKLVEGVLPLYGRLYSRPEVQDGAWCMECCVPLSCMSGSTVCPISDNQPAVAIVQVPDLCVSSLCLPTRSAPPRRGHIGMPSPRRYGSWGLQLAEHCRKRWEDLRRWARKISEAQLGKSSQCGRGARRALTPLMRMILVVAYPVLDGRLKAAHQSQGGEYSQTILQPGRMSVCAIELMVLRAGFLTGVQLLSAPQRV